MARVRVSDATCEDFRRAAGGRPLSRHLASLVERDVARWRAQRVRAGVADDVELLAAAEQARVLRDQLEKLVTRIEWRLAARDHEARSDEADAARSDRLGTPWWDDA